MAFCSFVVPAYDEEDYVGNCVRSIRDAADELELEYEVIVVDNNSTDRTAEVAENAGARVVFEPINQISRARNTGAERARGSYYVFVDADSTVRTPLLRKAKDALEQQRAVGGGAPVTFDRKSAREQYGSQLETWNWISRNWQLAAGSFLFCTREAFEWTGGFSEQVYASEELWLSRELKRFGRFRQRPFVILSDVYIQTSARKMDWFPAWQQYLGVLLFLLMPWVVFSPSLTRWFWYTRPD